MESKRVFFVAHLFQWLNSYSFPHHSSNKLPEKIPREQVAKLLDVVEELFSHFFWKRWFDYWRSSKTNTFLKNNGGYLSNGKKPWLFRVYKGLYYLYMWGLFHQPWSKDPVIKQPCIVMESVRDPCFFSWAHLAKADFRAIGHHFFGR